MARIGLVAHDDKKDELVAWALKHKHKLSEHELWGTGTSGGRVTDGTGLPVTLGGMGLAAAAVFSVRRRPWARRRSRPARPRPVVARRG